MKGYSKIPMIIKKYKKMPEIFYHIFVVHDVKTELLTITTPTVFNVGELTILR